MNLLEYQAQHLLQRFGIPTANSRVAFSVDEIRRAVQSLKMPLMIKAQIHAGGRGKAGGVRQASDVEEAVAAAEAMLNRPLITAQTGSAGQLVRCVLVSEVLDMKKELYVGILLDRARNQPVIMLCTKGGMDIEKVAQQQHEFIIREYIDFSAGLLPFQCRRLAFFAGLEDTMKQSIEFFAMLYKAYVHYDCTLLEINPFVISTDNRLFALDTKMSIDDNALFRHAEIAALHDSRDENPLEAEAEKYHLNYIKLSGSIACMVNGAGLAMATMDLIKLAGAEPANFLDVGGAASRESIEKGFGLLFNDSEIKAVLVNIFGGIVRCDRVAHGIVAAAKQMNVDVPVILRLAGTHAEEASEILRQSGLNFCIAATLDEAAEKVKQYA